MAGKNLKTKLESQKLDQEIYEFMERSKAAFGFFPSERF